MTAPGPKELREDANPGSGPDPGGDLALVVDDDDTLRRMLTEILSDAGLRCIQADDGERALALLDRHRPALAVLDLALPGMNGAELGWRIKKRMPGLPILALSGRLESWDPDDLKDLGFDHVLAKPMDCDEFVRLCLEVSARGREAPPGPEMQA